MTRTAKVAIRIDRGLLGRLDALVRKKAAPNRSRAIAEAVVDRLARLDRSRLARECAKLDPKIEQAIADEGFAGEIAQWPEY